MILFNAQRHRWNYLYQHNLNLPFYYLEQRKGTRLHVTLPSPLLENSKELIKINTGNYEKKPIENRAPRFKKKIGGILTKGIFGRSGVI